MRTSAGSSQSLCSRRQAKWDAQCWGILRVLSRVSGTGTSSSASASAKCWSDGYHSSTAWNLSLDQAHSTATRLPPRSCKWSVDSNWTSRRPLAQSCSLSNFQTISQTRIGSRSQSASSVLCSLAYSTLDHSSRPMWRRQSRIWSHIDWWSSARSLPLSLGATALLPSLRLA